MDRPVFPEEFVRNHCRKVVNARSWRKQFKLPPDDEDDMAHAECAFHNAGAGKECESCRLFMTRPFLHHKMDEKYLPQIEKFYKDLEIWEKEQDRLKLEEERITHTLGSGI